jgi:hypothetical protein
LHNPDCCYQQAFGYSQDNRKGHYGEDNNIYLNDTNLNNTKDLATTLGHETLLVIVTTTFGLVVDSFNLF